VIHLRMNVKKNIFLNLFLPSTIEPLYGRLDSLDDIVCTREAKNKKKNWGKLKMCVREWKKQIINFWNFFSFKAPIFLMPSWSAWRRILSKTRYAKRCFFYNNNISRGAVEEKEDITYCSIFLRVRCFLMLPSFFSPPLTICRTSSDCRGNISRERSNINFFLAHFINIDGNYLKLILSNSFCARSFFFRHGFNVRSASRFSIVIWILNTKVFFTGCGCRRIIELRTFLLWSSL
jgi:hypothetical protein